MITFDTLASPDHWKHKRTEYMDAARNCRQVVTDPNGFWRYSPDDSRVAAAVAFWVKRARNAHAFALGRKPVIPNFVVMKNGQAVEMPLYAQ